MESHNTAYGKGLEKFLRRDLSKSIKKAVKSADEKAKEKKEKARHANNRANINKPKPGSDSVRINRTPPAPTEQVKHHEKKSKIFPVPALPSLADGFCPAGDDSQWLVYDRSEKRGEL